MQRIPITLAEAGMVLARDVVQDDNPNGPPICGKGMVLTDSLLERLKRLDVAAVTVDGHPVRLEGDKSPEEIRRDLDRRFKKVVGDALTEKVKRVYENFLVKALGE
jgi:hypothetical protein